MLYIKFTKDYLEYFEEVNFLNKVIFLYRKIFGKITNVKTPNGEVWLVPEDNKKFRKSIIKKLKMYQVKTVVLSNNLKDFKTELEELKIKALDGKWLYKYLILDIIKYICENRSESLAEQNISFVVKNPQDVDFENLKNLAHNCRTVNLITKDDYRFRRLEKALYDEEGIILNISYNYKKSLLKSGIIINIDLDEKEFNKFAIPRKAVILNMKDIKIYNKGFNGINILKCEIDFPEKYNDSILNLDNFNKEILYESFLYKKTAPQNILNKIKQDEVKITHLLGKNGYIDKKEYSKV